MSGKIYNKNLTFLQDQPFAENFLTGSSFNYKKRRVQISEKRDSLLPTPYTGTQSSVGIQSFGENIVRNKSEKMRKAETSLVKHFCLTLERAEGFCESSDSTSYYGALKVGNSTPQTTFVLPHLLVSVDSMRNTLLSTRSSRTIERGKTPSQFKKILRECRKIRLLYGNLSKRHLSRATTKVRFPGENLLIWLESRLDVVLERCGFFRSIKAARQSVLNGKILVNYKVVRSPGFVLVGGDIIKVIQERLLAEPLLEEFSTLKRGVVLSNSVLARSERNKSLAFAISKRSSRFKGCEKKVDTGIYRAPVLGVFPYKSFHTWLVYQKQKDLSEKGGIKSKTLVQTDLQSKVSVQANFVWLHQKVSSSQSWRFIGSPHLLFSLFYLHTHLQKIMSLVGEALNGVGRERDLLSKHKSYKTQNWTKTSACMPELTRRGSELCALASYRGGLTPPTILSLSGCRAVNTFGIKVKSRTSEISEGINSLVDGLKIKPFINLICQFLSQNKNNGVKKKESYQPKDPFQVSSGCLAPSWALPANGRAVYYLPPSISITCSATKLYSVKPKVVSQSFTYNSALLSSRGSIVTDIHEFFGEDHVSAVTEVYNNLFSAPRFTCFSQDDYFSRCQLEPEPSSGYKAELAPSWALEIKRSFSYARNKKTKTSQLESSIVRSRAKLDLHSCFSRLVDEGDLLRLLFSDLLLYSLLIKSLHAQLKKQQLDSRFQLEPEPSSGYKAELAPSWASPARITSDLKQRAFDCQLNPNFGNSAMLSSRVDGANSAMLSSQVFAGNPQVNHRFTYPSKVEHKKININQGFGTCQAMRIKPLHLEVSYQSLCAVYLYPPQRVCLPVMIDVDCLAKAF
jgi:ribosomal protein S4